jgi:hypothetical protein
MNGCSARLDELGELGLLLADVDVRVAVVGEDPELVARRTSTLEGWMRVVGERVDADASGGERLADRAVGQDHAGLRRLTVDRLARVAAPAGQAVRSLPAGVVQW